MPLVNGNYVFREWRIPAHMLDSLLAYVDDRRPVGHFLTAIICNDLKEAVNCADDENLRNLPAYVGYLYNEAPMICWGSKEKMYKWLAERE